MIVIDVGNTNIVVGIYYRKKLNKIFRLHTEKNKKKFNLLFDNFLKSKKIEVLKKDNNICILSSVVPTLNLQIKKIFLRKKFKFYRIDPNNIPFKIKINYKLSQIGSDRIANFIAIKRQKISSCIIIDFGTATTFDVIKNNEYFGGLIFPGITLSMNSLINNAELLKKSKIAKVNKIIARNTASSIQSGFYFGYLHAINGILKQIVIENKFKPKVYITGGLGKIFKDKIDFNPIYNEYLTLDGIREIGKKIYNE